MGKNVGGGRFACTWGPAEGPRRRGGGERDRRCGRDEARSSNAVRSVVARTTGASASCPSSSPRVRRFACYIASRRFRKCYVLRDDCVGRRGSLSLSLSLLDSEIFSGELSKRGVCFWSVLFETDLSFAT